MTRRLILAIPFVLLAGSATAQVVQCIDEKGVKTIANFCPPGTVKEIKMMKSAPSTPSGGSAQPKSTAEREAEFRKRNMERQDAEKKADKDAAEAQVAERNCNDSRSQLRALQEGQRIARTDPNTGERSFLEDKDRPGEIANAQKAVDTWCKK